MLIESASFPVERPDDLFIDICFAGRFTGRSSSIRSARRSPKKSSCTAGAAVAIMIPGGRVAVIRPMLLNTLRALNYSNYHISSAPIRRHRHPGGVEKVREQSDRVHPRRHARRRPTNKADCLN
jgi:hypothetical protein